MVNDEIGKNARLLIENGKVKKISDTMWEVGEEMVRKISKPGRSFFTCTCDSYLRHCASPQGSRCYHREAVIIFNSKFQEEINKLIKYYDFMDVDEKIDASIMSMHLKDLRRIK